MRALYLSMRRAQAASLPERHSFTRRVSFHLDAGPDDARSDTLLRIGLIERGSPGHFSDRAAQHSITHKVRERRDENCRRSFWHRPGYPGWPERSWVGTRREVPARDRKVFFSDRRCAPTFGLPSGGRSPLPTESMGAAAKG